MLESLNSIVKNNATQTKVAAKEKDSKIFENSMKAEFNNLNKKTNENVKILERQIKLHENIFKRESAIANKTENIIKLFSKNATLERLVSAKIEQIVAQPKTEKKNTYTSSPPPPTQSTKPKEKEKKNFSLPFFPKNPQQKLSRGGVSNNTIGVDKQKDKKTDKSESYSRTIALPLQASGIAAVTVLGEFINSTGSLGAFFAPYLKSIVTPYALSLGVSQNLLNTLLVSPINTAILNLKSQEKDFTKTWGEFFNDNNFIDKFINREAGTTGPPPSGVGTDFWTLAAMCAVEDGRGQGNADVAQSVYNRIADGSYEKTIYDVITADGQYQVAYIDPTASSGPGTKTDEIWKSINDEQSAGAAICSYYKKRGQTKTIESCAAQAKKAGDDIRNTSYQKEAAAFVGGRTDYLANDPDGVQRPEGGNSFTWKYGKKFATGTPWSLTAAPIPAFSKGGSGKKAIMASTPFVVSGPKSGFDYVLRDDIGRPYPVTLHGTELIDPQGTGFKVYPIQNRSYDITKDPLALQKRWRDIAYDTGEKSTASYSSGGSAEFWKIAALASKEDSLHSQGQADVAQSLYNRAAIGSYPGGKSITSIIMAPGQYQPTFTNAGSWNAIRDRKSAIAAAGNAKKVDMAAASITNPSLQKAAQKFVGGRTDFMGESQKPYMKPGDITRGKNYNFHGWFYDAKLPNPAPVPKMISSVTTPITSASKPKSKIIVNSVASPSQKIIQSVQNAIKFIPDMIFNPNKVRTQLNMQRGR